MIELDIFDDPKFTNGRFPGYGRNTSSKAIYSHTKRSIEQALSAAREQAVITEMTSPRLSLQPKTITEEIHAISTVSQFAALQEKNWFTQRFGVED